MNHLSKSISCYQLIITTGDEDGIGSEVTFKAIRSLSDSLIKKFQVVILFSKNSRKLVPLLGKKKKMIQAEYSVSPKMSIDLILASLPKSPGIFLIENSQSPTQWVITAAKHCLKNSKFSALVTGPLSKEKICADGFSYLGHTDILKQISKVTDAYMAFKGSKFNVVLATGHIPLSNVSESLPQVNWSSVFSLSQKYFQASKVKPMALVGVNPHNGENGLISSGEEAHLNRQIENSAWPIEGPLVPDAAFLKANWKKFSVFITCYHDQGLIPFKVIHGQDSGVHITLGIPFIRTSVDHGTAKDIFGKGRANPNSMKEALLEAIRLLKIG